MSKCILGPSTAFGLRHSAQVCSICGAISVFLDGKHCARFNEDCDEVRVLMCTGSMRQVPFSLKAVRGGVAIDTLPPDKLQQEPALLQVIRGGSPVFQIVERGDRIEKMLPG